MNLTLIYIFRLAFLALIVFEFLNYVGVLRMSVEYTWLGLVVTSVFSFALLEGVAYKYKKIKGKSFHWFLWFFVVAGLSIDAFGDLFHFYGKYSWWDQFAHLFLSAVLFFILLFVIRAFWKDAENHTLRLSIFLAAASAMSLASLYEIEEYLEDLIFNTNRLGPGTDTANDLFLNLLGILIAVFLVIVFKYFKK